MINYNSKREDLEEEDQKYEIRAPIPIQYNPYLEKGTTDIQKMKIKK